MFIVIQICHNVIEGQQEQNDDGRCGKEIVEATDSVFTVARVLIHALTFVMSRRGGGLNSAPAFAAVFSGPSQAVERRHPPM